MMLGIDPLRIAKGNSLPQDAFPTEQFDYMLANPHYGVDSKKYAGAHAGHRRRP